MRSLAALSLATVALAATVAFAQRSVKKPVSGPAVPAVLVLPEAVATEKIKDLQVTVRLNASETDFDELKKIGGAFATSYRIPRYRISYQNPNRMRVEGKLGILSALIIFDGNTKHFKVPLHTETEDVTGKPGKKQSLMDLGLFARDYLKTDYKPEFQRRDGSLLVFKLIQRFSESKSYEVVWVNPKTAITEKRQSLNGEGMLVKEIRYVAPKELAPGIYLASRVEIYNQFGKLGAVQDVEEVSVNQGVPDSLFRL